MIDLEAARKTAEEAQRRADKATPGPWEVTGGHNRDRYSVRVIDNPRRAVTGWGRVESDLVDAEFIAEARSDVPALCALIRDMADEIGRYQKILADLRDSQRAWSPCEIANCGNARCEIGRILRRFE